MANNGVITARTLKDSGVLRTKLATDIIKTSAEEAILNNPAIVRTYTGGDIRFDFAFMGAVAVERDVAEGQEVAIQTPEFSSTSINLTKDVVAVALSDEAIIRSEAHGISLKQMIQDDASAQLAAIINEKIAVQLNTTPQTGTSFGIRDDSIYLAIAEAQSMLPDAANITAIVCGRRGKVEIMNNLNKVAYGGATPGAPARADVIPGLDIPVFASAAVDSIDGNAVYFVSNNVPAVAWCPGQVKTEIGRDIKSGVDLFKINSWSAARGNLKQTDDNKNLGVIKTAWSTT